MTIRKAVVKGQNESSLSLVVAVVWYHCGFGSASQRIRLCLKTGGPSAITMATPMRALIPFHASE